MLAGTFATTRALRPDPRYAPRRGLLGAFARGALAAVLLLRASGLRPRSLGGLYEKAFLGCELAWMLTLSLWVARLEPQPGRRGPGSRPRR